MSCGSGRTRKDLCGMSSKRWSRAILSFPRPDINFITILLLLSGIHRMSIVSSTIARSWHSLRLSKLAAASVHCTIIFLIALISRHEVPFVLRCRGAHWIVSIDLSVRHRTLLTGRSCHRSFTRCLRSIVTHYTCIRLPFSGLLHLGEGALREVLQRLNPIEEFTLA